MFHKLESRHDIERGYLGELQCRFGQIVNNKFTGITYYAPDAEVVDKMFAILRICQEDRSKFQPIAMLINCAEVPPHTDSGILTTVNFYVETANGVTKFFNRTNATVGKKLHNQTDGSIFDKESLEVHSSFCANSGDIYVLNVKEIHSVFSEPGKDRFAYCLQTSMIPYEQVLQMLCTKNLV